MIKKRKLLGLCLSMAMLAWPAIASGKKRDAAKAETTAAGEPGALWRDPVDTATRNLFYGPGGKEHEPHGPTTFLKEDLDGTNPKIVVRDEDGVKWKVKMGAEARPETASTRLVWSAGYFNEDYFVPRLQVANMPARLHRGQKYVPPMDRS